MVGSWVGYTGGTDPAPTYASVCARNNTHTEAVKLAFDPAQISYEELMQRLVDDPRVHAPWSDAPPSPPQYRTAVWAQSEAQLEVARRVLADGGKGTIPVLPSSEWFDAEEYHQNFLSEFKDLPDEDDEDNPWGTTNGPGTSMGL